MRYWDILTSYDLEKSKRNQHQVRKRLERVKLEKILALMIAQKDAQMETSFCEETLDWSRMQLHTPLWLHCFGS